MKNYTSKVIIIVLILLAFVFMIKFINSSQYYRPYEEEHFGKKVYSEINKKCSKKDKKEIEQFLKTIDEAFSFIGVENEAREKYGELSRYSMCRNVSDDKLKNILREEHTINFITAKLNGSNSYVWINYSQFGYDHNNERICGSSDINSRIKIKKNDGIWKAVSIDEAP